MQKATRRLVLAVVIHPSTIKVCARYAFRLVRRLGRVAEQAPDRIRRPVRDVRAARTAPGQETPR